MASSSSSTAMMELAVVIYRPLGGNYHHWGFHLHSPGTDTHRIFQTDGPPNQLEAMISNEHPNSSSARLLKRILLGGIYEGQASKLRQIIRDVPMQNDVASWDCQEYVIDIMDALEAEGLLGSRPKYDAIKSAVKNMRGDVDSTRRAVMSYNYNRLGDEASEEEASDGESDNDGEDEEEQPGNIRSADIVEDSDEE